MQSDLVSHTYKLGFPLINLFFRHYSRLYCVPQQKPFEIKKLDR